MERRGDQAVVIGRDPHVGVPGLADPGASDADVRIPGLAGQLIAVLCKFLMGNQEFPPLTALKGDTLNDLQKVGETLFSTHTLPFQVIGVLILVATVGVIVISKRELK